MIERLKAYLRELTGGGIALAYSGGVDSTLLLAVLAGLKREKPFAAVALTMQTLLQDCQEMSEAEKQAAAMLLDPQLSPYRGIRNHEYTKQTAEIKGMLAILALEENMDALQTLGLTEEVEALREANTAFETAFLAKGVEMNAKSQLSDIDTKTLLNETNALYQEIVKIVNAYAIVDTNAGIREFIANVNGLVGIYSGIAGSSQSGGSAPEGDGAEFPDT